MRSYNILYLHNKSGISGGERSLLNLWENLDRKEFALYLIVPSKGDFSLEAEKKGVKVSFLEIPRLNMMNSGVIIKRMLSMVQYVRAHNIDLIHSYTPRNNILGAGVAKFCSIPVIWHERNMLYGGEKDVTAKFFFLPDKIICNSKAVAGRFGPADTLPSRVAVILNGVDLARFNPSADKEKIIREFSAGGKKIVGVVSNMNSRKRVDYFLEAASIINKRRDDVLFLVVGGEFTEAGSGRRSELTGFSEILGLKKNIVFTGFRDDIPELLSAMDISVNVTEKEACSRAVIESMASGKPVVAMNDGGNPELVENGISGVLVDPCDIRDFVAQIEGLLSDDNKRKEMGERARERAEKLFDVKRNARQTADLYRELVDNGRAGWIKSKGQ
ncbi:MAG: glycosyltransferase family 4 protein [Candidatus Omnitrophota bacterium]